MARIVVAGSLNMDFVARVERLPAAGETVLGGAFQMIPGGKGANQAFAAGRLAGEGTSVHMVGRVGYDLFADHLKASLAAAGVDVQAVHATRDHPTGVAMIWVDRGGQNSIVVAPGANHAWTAGEAGSVRALFQGAAYALFQLETPLDTVMALMRLAKAEGVKIILDPAPAQALPGEMLAMVDILTPNETEAKMLGSVTGPRAVLYKLGDRGCRYVGGGVEMESPAFPVVVQDTTAAGDTFNGALAVALAEGLDLRQALRFANAAGAISVTRMGAQASIPGRSEVDSFLAGHEPR